MMLEGLLGFIKNVHDIIYYQGWLVATYSKCESTLGCEQCHHNWKVLSSWFSL